MHVVGREDGNCAPDVVDVLRELCLRTEGELVASMNIGEIRSACFGFAASSSAVAQTVL
jgi:hypothetical protein